MIIRVINPTITARWDEETQATYTNAAQSGTEIRVVSLAWGTASIESFRDEALVVPDILDKVVQSEREGMDAVIIDCMSDPGLYPARELVRIPVVGPCEASMHMGAILGHRFSVLTVFDSDIPAVEDLATRYGLATKLASVRAFNIPVLELHNNLDSTVQTLVDLSNTILKEDGAHVLIPGCTGLAGLAPRIQAKLAEHGWDVPVLDPPSVAVNLAESMVHMSLTQSKRTYEYPPSKKVVWPVEAAIT
jgi:allantoin racemase